MTMFAQEAWQAEVPPPPLLNYNELKRSVAILGCRGIPASYGGFETFAERLALYLVERGWDVTVYCQSTTRCDVDMWNGIRRVHVRVGGDGPLATMLFDLKSTLKSLRSPELPLVLGYNTAILSALYRLRGRTSLMNMDGIEWQRTRWSRPVRAWFRLNEWFGCRFSNHLIADHPEIARHLGQVVKSDKITTIAYGADRVERAGVAPVRALGLEPRRYALAVARFVPENSVLETVRAWTDGKVPLTLAVVGTAQESDPYTRQVLAAAGPNVRFLGGVYDRELLKALRHHARFHVHGHQVGGTNPSLIEALAAGSPVIAHDNPFNRWVAGPSAQFFSDELSLSAAAAAFSVADDGDIASLRRASRRRFEAAFRWEAILADYEKLLLQWVSR